MTLGYVLSPSQGDCSPHAATQAAGVLIYALLYVFHGPPNELGHMRLDMQGDSLEDMHIRKCFYVAI